MEIKHAITVLIIQILTAPIQPTAVMNLTKATADTRNIIMTVNAFLAKENW